jgi:heptosyltransferase II
MKILVRGTNWIGDAVMSVPALRALRRIFPGATIALHTRSWADGLFRDVDFIDELVTFDPTRSKVKDVYTNSQFLRDDGYDLAVLLPNSFESALVSFLTRVPRRFGYNKDARGLLLTDPVPVPEWKDRRHEVFYYLNLIADVERRILGRDTVAAFEPDIRLEISAERIAEARQFLTRSGVDPERPLVILGTGSTNSRAKRWPADRFAELNDRLQQELGVNVALLGSRAESDAARRVMELAAAPPIDLVGKTGLPEAAAVLAVADLLVSNDMGLAHIAPAVGTSTLVLFGPTNPETTRPFSDIALVIREPVDCSPCMLRDCPIDHRCMMRITVANIFDAARNTLTLPLKLNI